LELVPQGTLAERLRAHAAGIPAFFTPTGASTGVEKGAIPIRYHDGGISKGVKIPGISKEHREFNGRKYVLEHAIAGDIAFVRAWKVDEVGNTVFRFVRPQKPARYMFNEALCRYTANNFNNAMGKNAKLTIVEVRSVKSGL
jgi:3-oxoacid CoA-transferase